mmetsp:Transcript_9884/g.43075  ORF Transcript_9884/g.43075 Transcript_9884/m.43075 type:complete len:258 (+) Transcript_9884:1259-2032(+)
MASARIAPGMSDVRTHELTVDARDSMSVSSNESAPWCQVDWSPTTLRTGELARRALWRLARALASPGPRCRRVHAGLRAILAYPSAAPLTTVSCSASTVRIASGPRESSAPTSHISVVPGLAKHTSTPPSCRARTRASAPFLGGARGEIEDGPRGAMATELCCAYRGEVSRNGRPDGKRARPPDFPTRRASRLRRFRGTSSRHRALPHRAADQSRHGRGEHRAPRGPRQVGPRRRVHPYVRARAVLLPQPRPSKGPD